MSHVWVELTINNKDEHQPQNAHDNGTEVYGHRYLGLQNDNKSVITYDLANFCNVLFYMWNAKLFCINTKNTTKLTDDHSNQRFVILL